MLYREAIAEVTLSAMRADPNVVLLGQGVTDAKGVFGTCLGAAREFPGRCIEAPVSETMLTGACVGLAMEGYKPILVHARADWSLLSFEHLINTGAKIPFLHDKPIPFIMRVLVGRGWGQGPVHSQSFHHMLAEIPGLNVVMPVTPQGYLEHFRWALGRSSPTVIIEPRRLYETSIATERLHGLEYMKDGWCHVNIVTLGDAALDALDAAAYLKNDGKKVSVIPWQTLGHPAPVLLAGPVLTVDIAPRRPQPGLLAPPFLPQGVSEVYEKAWYVTPEAIVKAAYQLMKKPYPSVEVEATPERVFTEAF